jgi:predicted Zn finger-like uncharacterized protein
MKIVCDSCGAKYSIADEKVAGKIFKIRCKKCSSVLEVRGDHKEAPEEDPATVVYDHRNEALWYVVVEGEQQGPLSPTQLMALFAKGSMNLDSYVWQEGFDDWKVARDVPAIAEILGTTGSEQDGATQAEPDETSAIGTGGDLFGSAGEDAGAQAQPASNMFSAFDAPVGDEDAQESAREPSSTVRNEGVALQTGTQQKMTGQRNENSVLFSLGNLQQLAAREPAPGGSAKAVSPQPQAAAPSSGEGSGLIDIRALAQATGSEGQRAAAADELLTLGTGIGSGTLGGPLLGPVPDEKAGRGPWIWVGGGAVSLLVVAALAIVGPVLFQKDSPEAQFEVKDGSGSAPTVDLAGRQADSTSAAAQRPSEDTQAQAVELDDSEESEEEALADAEEPAEAPSLTETKKPAARTSTRSSRRRTRSTSSAPSSESQAKAAAPKPKSNNLDALMDEVIGGSSATDQKKSAASSSSGSNLPEAPSRDDVKRALAGISGAVRSCKKDESGTALVSVTFSGKTGRASSADVASGPFKGTPVGACIEKAAMRARVPRFKQSTFNVKFPYRL